MKSWLPMSLGSRKWYNQYSHTSESLLTQISITFFTNIVGTSQVKFTLCYTACYYCPLSFWIKHSWFYCVSSILSCANTSLTCATVIALSLQIRHSSPPALCSEVMHLLLTQIRSMTQWTADRIGCHAGSNHRAYASLCIWVGFTEAACYTPHLWQLCLQHCTQT